MRLIGLAVAYRGATLVGENVFGPSFIPKHRPEGVKLIEGALVEEYM